MTIRAIAAPLAVCVLSVAFVHAAPGTALVLANGRVVLVPMTAGGPGTADTIYGPAQWIGTDWRTNAGIKPTCFSPDGRRIAFAKGEWLGPSSSKRMMVYTMSNDGTHIDTICQIRATDANGLCMSWTSTGYLYWCESDPNVYRASLATKQYELVATLDDFTGDKPDPLRIDGLQMSLDGTRAGYMLFGVGYCMSLDFATMIGRNYGSGCQGTVSPNGQLVTHSYSGYIPGYSFHQVGAIHEFLTETVVDTFFAPGAAPNQTGSLPRIVFIRFSHSSNTHVLFSGEDALDGNGYVHDLTSNVTQVVGDCQPSDYWVGTLPSPDAPFIALTPSLLVFSSPDGSPPASQTVTASNTGTGSLGTLTTTVNPASATWLNASASGTTITNTVTPGSLPRGTYYATVAVASGSALNTAVYSVVVNVHTTVNAPTNVRLGKIWHASEEPQGCVGVAWRDNSSNETGFVVERAMEGGEFARIATVAANATSYADTVPGVGVWTYRVLAITATDSSGLSNEATIRVSFPLKITVTAPDSGTVWPGGTTQYIRWHTDGVPNVQIQYCPDGEDWLLITGTGSVSSDSADWGNYAWVVPALDRDNVEIRVEAYGDRTLYGSAFVNIHPSTAVAGNVGGARRTLPAGPAAVVRAGRTATHPGAPVTSQREVYDIRGARMGPDGTRRASGITITAPHR